MSERIGPDRRRFMQWTGAAVAAPAILTAPAEGALAQTITAATDPLGTWRELRALAARAADLGIAVPSMSARIDINDGRDYQQLLPAAVELIDSLETSDGSGAAPAAEAQGLLQEAYDLQRRVHQAERNLPDDFDAEPSATTTPGRPTFDSIKASYRQLFDSCKVREANRQQVEWYISKLLDPRYQDRWYKAAKSLCCPWYFIAVIHALEGGFNFNSHLHNGDPLSARTRQIPRGRPKTWNPPNDWESSATDALLDRVSDSPDWSVERTLYRWESYNGFRSRRNGINTPYLWSFSNHYSKGKYVADNVWDPNAVSKQCGAAVMLKVLDERRLVRLTA